MTVLHLICEFILIFSNKCDLIQRDRDVLIDIYSSANGSYWNQTWNYTKLLNQTICPNDLHGVVCDSGNSLVQELNLNDNNLNGTIPNSIGNLTSLNWLDLSKNQLTGTISNNIGKLTSLHVLYLQNNQLTGTIPNNIGNLTSLNWLYLSNNQLTGTIPNNIGNLTSLYVLYLHNNQLTGTIPNNICNITSLNWLD
eukprot:23215_1